MTWTKEFFSGKGAAGASPEQPHKMAGRAMLPDPSPPTSLSHPTLGWLWNKDA